MLYLKKSFISGILCIGILPVSLYVHAQTAVAQENRQRWMTFEQGMRTAASDTWNIHGQEMGLSAQDEMRLVSRETDRLGWTHRHFQQHYRGVPVEFAVYKLHARDGEVVRGNGELVRDLNLDVIPKVTYNEALHIALETIGAAKYYWQMPYFEKLKKHATDDPDATFFPTGELLIASEDFDMRASGEYLLAWKFEIYAAEPESREWIYIDARTGELIKRLDLDMHSSGYPGVAETRYSGLREIVTDSTANGYILIDVTRGGGVETYDARDTTGGLIAHFVDDDNYWSNANERADDAATDAHWAAEQYHDYMLLEHGFNSYNNLGSKLICLVHYGKDWRNAQWTGFWTRYGDGDKGEPWTHVNVVGHEFTHGFIWATAALLYESESGALNESLADIFGEALQEYTSDSVDWLISASPVDTLRSMREPKVFGQPHTYHGENWDFEDERVHTNSGVQNHWFHLLVAGGSGTNDNGSHYEVQAIGMDDAMDIVFRNATVYLFPTADYFDARQGSLQAAEDLYGACSFQYQQVANAWHAVGVGDRSEMEDFSVTDIGGYDLCSVGTMAPVSMTVKHLGCDTTGPVQLVLTLIKSNPLRTIRDTLDVPAGIGPGEAFTYTFSEEIDFARTGEHSLTARVTVVGDPNTNNDAFGPVIVHNLRPVRQQDFRFHTLFVPRTFRDSMAFIPGSLADLDILPNIGSDSTYGIRVQGDRLRYALPVLAGQDVFDMNHRLGTQICMCVDADGLQKLDLQFDLRQTYSRELQDLLGPDQPKSCAMRVLADDSELARYVPVTTAYDPWRTHRLDLSAYLGQHFTLCFETRTYSDRDEDPAHVGDRVFLDNILIMGEEVALSAFEAPGAIPLAVFPNPATSEVFIEIEAEMVADAEILLSDVNSRRISQQHTSLHPGINQLRFDVTTVPAGVYVIEVRSANWRGLAKLIIQ